MTESNRLLSAYAPARQLAPATTFSIPMQVYIIETIERNAHTRRTRQFITVAALVVGMFVSQWPAAFSAANAVPSLPISAKSAGARTPSTIAIERLAFAPHFASR